MSIRLVIVDDQGMVRAGFRSLLADEPDFEVVGEAANGEEARRARLAAAPGRDPDGHPDAGPRRHRRDPASWSRRRCATKVLVLTTFDLDEYVFEALRAGASGFLLKDAPAEELAAAIRVVAAGESLLAPGVTRRVIDAFVRRARPADRAPRAAPRLADPARARGARAARARAVQPRHRHHGCSSPRAPPRPT